MRSFLQTQALARLMAAFCSGAPVDIASTSFYPLFNAVVPHGTSNGRSRDPI